jgi:hypothetical protein
MHLVGTILYWFMHVKGQNGCEANLGTLERKANLKVSIIFMYDLILRVQDLIAGLYY